MSLSFVTRALLAPLSLVYGAIVLVRNGLYARGLLKQKRLGAGVISVGNLTVGGTGKTPMVIWLAEQFLAQGKHVAILSRGYRGEAGTSDEIELMKYRLQGRVAFGIGKDRFATGRQLGSQHVDVFILDDGFQHRRLARDVDIVLIDSSQPLGGQALLPAGRLREPVAALSRADLIVFTRAENTEGTQEAIEKLTNFPIFAASTRLVGFRRLSGDDAMRDVSGIGSGPFLAFCGIGNPRAFIGDLRNWGVPLAAEVFFRDHHKYSVMDVTNLEARAREAGARGLVTTEKDAQNLAGLEFRHFSVEVAAIEFTVSSEAEFLAAIRGKLELSRGAAA